MLLIVKILSWQSVKGGFQSNPVLLWFLYYSYSLTIIPLVTLVTLLLFITLYYPLLPLFLFFFPLNLTYLLITKDYRKRKTLMSLSLDISISVLPPSIICDFPINQIITNKRRLGRRMFLCYFPPSSIN